MSIMRRVLAVLVVIVVAGLFSSGCASYRIGTTMEAPGVVKLPPEVRFQIASVSFVVPTNVPTAGTPDFGKYEIDQAGIRDLLVSAGRKHYPWVFADTAEAIPLNVTITRKSYETDAGADICISCLTLTILPMRSVDRVAYEVVLASPAETVSGLMSVEFTREEANWMSFFPTGWIPVPGGRGQRVIGMDSAWEKTGEIMAKACVDAIVKAIRRVDASAWKASQPVK